MQSASSKAFFAELLERKDEIEGALREAGVPETVHWYNPENAQVCRIYVRRDADIANHEDWPEQQRWLLERAEAFTRVFAPIAKQL